ncbi:hypothetical protein ACFQU2_20785 [Siccirubricoccus deserti]
MSVTPDLARRARIAWRRFGKGATPPGWISATASPMLSPRSAASPCCSRAMSSPRPM